MNNRRRARLLRGVLRDRRKGYPEYLIRTYWFPRSVVRWRPFPPVAAEPHGARVAALNNSTSLYGPPIRTLRVADLHTEELVHWLLSGPSLTTDLKESATDER